MQTNTAPPGVGGGRTALQALLESGEAAVTAGAIQAGLENRSEAMEYALGFGRGLDTALADRFVGMYVNELTCDYGDEGRQAVSELLRRGEELGAFPAPVQLEFVS